jgi:small subunit ribosomal protein S1
LTFVNSNTHLNSVPKLKLEVQVLELDTEQRRLALSHKHMEENPWDTFEPSCTKQYNKVKNFLVNKK